MTNSLLNKVEQTRLLIIPLIGVSPHSYSRTSSRVLYVLYNNTYVCTYEYLYIQTSTSQISSSTSLYETDSITVC